jgi:CubicO group peptidase (beta-lactamase class C family)
VLARGTSNGREIVPSSWIDRTLTYRVTIEHWFGYGYQWYVSAISTPDGTWHPWVGALGNGGQRIDVVSDLGLVVAFAAGQYDAEDSTAMTMSVLEDVILASLEP